MTLLSKPIEPCQSSTETKSKKRVPSPVDLDCPERVEEFLSRFDYIVSDCDGVLWVNKDAVTGAPETMNKLRAKGKKIIFASNNCGKTREEFCGKLNKLGYIADISEVYPTSFATAEYLNSIGFNRKAYLIGSQGLADELSKVGIESIGVGPDAASKDWTPGMAEVDLDPDVGAVIVGLDNQISFPKLVKASSYAKNPHCLLISTCVDETFPNADHSVLVPGPGAYIAAIQTATRKEAVSIGKPSKYFFDCIRTEHPDIDPSKTIMIGDRLTTDIVFGRNNGLSTLFVETGNSTYDEMVAFTNSDRSEDHLCVPDYHLRSLADINKYL